VSFPPVFREPISARAGVFQMALAICRKPNFQSFAFFGNNYGSLGVYGCGTVANYEVNMTTIQALTATALAATIGPESTKIEPPEMNGETALPRSRRRTGRVKPVGNRSRKQSKLPLTLFPFRSVD
jgi:hypothetical protein